MYEIMGARVHAVSQGEGDPVVILHGWGSSRAVMRPIALRLAESGRRVVTLDFPGFGSSPPPPAAWGVPEYAEMLTKLLDRMGLCRPVLIGHSFGGRVILYAVGALKYPADRLVLIDSAGIKQPPSRRRFGFAAAKRLAALLPKKAREALLAKARRKYGSADYLAAEGVMREVLVKTVNHDLADLLPDIENEALLIWGSADTATPVADGRRMASLMQNARIEVIEGAGHYAFLDAPEKFFTILESWL
ncbi:MAG TPA: alpha/beta hydrolase [Candidatus Acidoferrum sp.]|nr:alpha/beta hydrolase [Candidatus Acidoferrum sp.]